MIVKALTRKCSKKASIKDLIDYVFAPEKLKDRYLDCEPLIVKRFIRGYDRDKWADAFKSNDDNRSFNHSKRTVLRHEFISFSDKEKRLTREILQDFAKWYLKYRCPNAMGVAGVHWEKAVHIHFIISGVGIDGKSTRISRQDFKNFKVRLQEFQKSKYPFLSHSIVEHTKKKVSI